MTMRVVGQQLYIGDEGRPIFLAGITGRQAYYIPFDDVPALDRRRVWWSIAGIVVFAGIGIGAATGAWSVWWCVLGSLTPLASPIVVARWASQRFEPVSDPSIATDVRRTGVLRGPTVRATIMMVLASCAVAALYWLDYAGRPLSFVLATGYVLMGVVQLFTVKRGRDEFGDGYEPPSSTGITR